jgi:tetratricopeptide (TPR) repeat protein
MVSTVLTILAQHGEGALPSMERLPLRFRLINAFHSPLFYAGKMLWPLDLVPIYPFPAHSDFLDLKYVFAPILVVGVTGVCLLLLKRGSYLLFTAWSYYLIALFPVVGVVQVGRQAAADRYTYLPSISIFLLVGMGVSWLAGRSSSVINKVMCGVLLVMLILLAQVTIQQIKIWQDPETLWSCVVKRLPGRVLIAHNNLGQVYSNKGMYDNAVVQFEKALAIDPNYAKAHNNLGLVYYAKGMFDEANAQFKNALTINPNLAEAYNNLGLVCYTKGMYDNAVVQFEKALAIDPNYANSHNNLGLVYYTKGMFDEAIAQFEKALAINPNYASTHNNIGLAYYKKGNYIVAKGHFDKALKLGYEVDPKLLESVKRDRSVR